MKQTLKRIFVFIVITFSFLPNIFARMASVIDYAGFNTSQCNAFSPSAVISSVTHNTTCGQPTFNNTSKYVRLSASNNNFDFKGTEYKINYNFKQGFSYKITVNAVSSTPASNDPKCRLLLGFTSVAGGSGSFCNGIQPISGIVQTSFNLNNQGDFTIELQ